MKTQTMLILGALAFTVHAKNIWAPDKSARIEADSSIDLFDEAQQTMTTLIPHANAAKKIEVSWAPDSKKVLVVESFSRGSVVFGAYKDGDGWHKVIEPDSDMARMARESIEAKASGGVIAENRFVKQWDSRSVEIEGEWTFRDGHHRRFNYTLSWRSGPGRIDRGGYEEGILTNE